MQLNQGFRVVIALTIGPILWIAGNAAAATGPTILPVEAFGTLPFMSDPVLSPSGRYIAAKQFINGDHYGLIVFDLEQVGKKPPWVARTPDHTDVNWIRWKSDDRLLFSIRFPGARGVDTLETRLFAVNPDGSDEMNLLRHSDAQQQDVVTDVLPGDPRHILLPDGQRDAPGLYKVDVYSAEGKVLEPSKHGMGDWLLDQQGRVRIGRALETEQSLLGTQSQKIKTYARIGDSSDWTLIREAPVESEEVFVPVTFERTDPDVLLVQSNHESGRTGLYKFRLSTRSFVEKVFLAPDVDIAGLVQNPVDGEVQGIVYVTDQVHVEWLDPAMANLTAELTVALPGWAISIVSRSRDGSRLLVEASAPDHSPRYYLYEPATKRLRNFAYTYQQLDRMDLAPVVPVSYKARDGLNIVAYLTLPRGFSGRPPTPLAAVVMPHGGPDARDYARFDPMVQAIARRGYAVLQMNFRGSAGYGSQFRKAGHREWGEAMQDDVTDGTRWLVQQKIADPARICIVGASYGGYAALMGVVKEPKLYKCAVSFAGVSDLVEFVDHQRFYVGGRAWTRELFGNSREDRQRLAQLSPSRRADAISAPILLLHGTKDRVVPVAQSQLMASALRSADRDCRYVELPDEEHWLSHQSTRLQFFRELDQFLAQHLH